MVEPTRPNVVRGILATPCRHGHSESPLEEVLEVIGVVVSAGRGDLRERLL